MLVVVSRSYKFALVQKIIIFLFECVCSERQFTLYFEVFLSVVMGKQNVNNIIYKNNKQRQEMICHIDNK